MVAKKPAAASGGAGAAASASASAGAAGGASGGGLAPPAARSTMRVATNASLHADASDGVDYGNGPRVVRPDDQESLTQAQLDEEVTRFLTANNPQAPRNVARFSYKPKEMSYRVVTQLPQEAVHLEIVGNIVHRETDEGRKLRAMHGAGASTDETGLEAVASTSTGQGEGDEDGEGGATGEGGAPAPQVLRNQFNFSERAAQTFNNPPRERGMETDPSRRSVFAAAVTQWEIYDAYVAEYQRQKAAKEKAARTGKAGSSTKKKGDSDELDDLAGEMQKSAEEALKSAEGVRILHIVERMVHQNSFHDIAHDFRYWDDVSDQVHPDKGSLLPLWSFQYERAKRKHVTALAWSATYPDMLIAGYGSYDFMRQVAGAVCIFSLKNPEFPERVLSTESGVMCLDVHPAHPSLLAVGMYDGSVLVFDVNLPSGEPLFASTTKGGKHTDPVWGVRWQHEDVAKNLNFFSISSDGRVSMWTLSKNELQCQDVTELRLAGADAGANGAAAAAASGAADTSAAAAAEGADAGAAGEGPAFLGLASGCCFDFHPSVDHIFIVGTEEGQLHKCSKAYNSQYLESYRGHDMVVYSVKYNPFAHDVFLSCSADWTVRLWRHDRADPILTFDLGCPVGDIAWAPYSSTVFAAATNDGKVHVFDINVNKYKPLCEQLVVRKTRVTHLAFNPCEPVLVVGDDKGVITSLKLSPNLRQRTDAGSKAEFAEKERSKLQAILTFSEKAQTAEW